MVLCESCSLCSDQLACFMCGWPKVAWVQYSGRKSLGFSVSMELYLFFVRVEENAFIQCGVELHLITM